jgi:hypothetical protein
MLNIIMTDLLRSTHMLNGNVTGLLAPFDGGDLAGWISRFWLSGTDLGERVGNALVK